MSKEDGNVARKEKLDQFGICADSGHLCIEGVRLEQLADEVGTPTYVYGLAHIKERYRRLQIALGENGLVCYAVKANSGQAILRHLGGLGAGADIVSGGELVRVLKAGIPPERIVFSGVGKTRDEIDAAISCGDRGILSINIESVDEIRLIRERAKALGKNVSVSLRLNPDVDPHTHPYLATGLRESKFGIAMEEGERLAHEIVKSECDGLRLVGLACHLGSQLVDPSSFLEGIQRMAGVVRRLKESGHELELLDLGGGFGIPYRPDEPEFDAESWGNAIRRETEGLAGRIVVEPGRYFVGNSGVLLTRVLGVKRGETKNFIVVDAAMNDLIRPALYEAHHEIVPIWVGENDSAVEQFDIVGPVCECGDFLALSREMPTPKIGDVLAVLSAGAYGSVMASNYNSRPRPAELIVDGERWASIRNRMSVEAMIAEEAEPTWR